MMRTILLGLLGLVLAVTVGFGVHLLTRDTISLPVVRLEAPPAPPTTTAATTTQKPTTSERTTTSQVTTVRPTATATRTEVETEDGGSGHGRGRGRGGDSARSGGDD